MITPSASLRLRFFKPREAQPPGSPKRPAPPVLRNLFLVGALAFCWVSIELTLVMWKSGEELPRMMGMHIGTLSTYTLCRDPVTAQQKGGGTPSLAVLEQQALCFTGDSTGSPDSVAARVAAAVAFERANAEATPFTALATNIALGVTPSHREFLASKGAGLPPATSSALGMLLTMGSVSTWQSEALFQHDNASFERARALARRVSREAIMGMSAESESLGSIDRRAPFLAWIAGRTGNQPKLFALSAQPTRKKALMSYWRLLHPVAPLLDGAPDVAAIEAQFAAGEAWLATMPRDEERIFPWLDAMERASPQIIH